MKNTVVHFKNENLQGSLVFIKENHFEQKKLCEECFVIAETSHDAPNEYEVPNRVKGST